MRPASIAAFETIIASAVLPVPKLPVSQSERPASRFVSMSATKARISRTWVGKRRCISITSECSKEIARKRLGIRASRARARVAAIRGARQRQSRAVDVSSSITKPLPSQRPNSQRWTVLEGAIAMLL